MLGGTETIEVVQRSMGEERADQILGFWSAHGALEGVAARERLAEVIAVALDDAGEVVGVNSAHAADAPPVNRRFWGYRSFLPDGTDELRSRMFNAAFEALSEGFDPDRPGPVGLCVKVSDPAEMERHPEAVWPAEELFFAGNLDDGSQLRIRYFWNAKIGPGPPDSPRLEDTRDADYQVGDRFRVVPFTDSGLTPGDILALWARETAIPEVEAQKRVHEVQLVAVKRDEGLVGVSTAYIERNPRLRMDLWNYRTFVAASQRHSNLAGRLALAVRDHLEQRFIGGHDTRAAGMAFEIENEGLKTYFNRALWLPLNFNFIGENQRGDHIRVHYFPGARVPLSS
jgi:hypothetical protein